MVTAHQMARQLGLAISPLFPTEFAPHFGEHFAMLDGRRASFAYSNVESGRILDQDSRNWQWSSDLAHHVVVTDGEIEVRSGREQKSRRFRRESIEGKLEDFLAFLDSSRTALPDVVSFLLGEFQMIWSNGKSDDGNTALASFLLALSAAGESDVGVLEDFGWRQRTLDSLGLEMSSHSDDFDRTSMNLAEGMQARAPYGLKLLPSLVLRHTAGRLFQDAHAVIESEQLGLFGPSKIITSAGYSPSGAYFTPVRIARVLTEWALQRWTGLTGSLKIADFACGSGVFLTEALRALERMDFRGSVEVIGRDSSPQAITMARVALRSVSRDLQNIEVVSNVIQADAFDSEWPQADVVLMNPPFRSWEKMTKREREWVSEVTGGANRGRPDLSVGFAERAIQCLGKSGVLATMIPAGVLASDGLAGWRRSMAQRATPTLIAVLGEHGLFQHALVNVGMIALDKLPAVNLNQPPQTLHVAWSSAEEGSASKAIRALRRSISQEVDAPRTDAAGGWSITTTSVGAWGKRHSWLPGAGALGRLLERIQSSTATVVADLFLVHQGIRTGANDAFLLSESQIDLYPPRERAYFRVAVDTESFVQGEIKKPVYLFMPDPTWVTDEDVSQAVPEFFNRHLRLRKPILESRKSLINDSRWWTLTRSRPTWAFDGRARLLSKRFGLFPAFARDLNGNLAPVQANAWVPKVESNSGFKAQSKAEALTAYWWLLNSRVMVALMREYCPNVAGGQLDLEHKYVKNVPLPDLIQRFAEDPALQSLATSIRSSYGEALPGILDLDHFAASAFSTEVADWNLSGLGVPTVWK